jgi:hypothetical protein
MPIECARLRQMDTHASPHDVAMLRESVARLNSLVVQLERALRVDGRADCAPACEVLAAENRRLFAMLKANPPPRPVMTPQRRLRLAAAQSWTCAVCGSLLGEHFHADHIVPWSDSYDDRDSNLQVICASPCHLAKTSREASCRRRAQVRSRHEALDTPTCSDMESDRA